MSTKFGAWTFKGPAGVDNDFAILDSQNKIIAETWGRVGQNEYPNARAHAHLMAIAPELLEALRVVKRAYNGAGSLEMYRETIGIALQTLTRYEVEK